jgi:hypothetical protein
MGVVGFSSPGFTSFRFRFGFLPPCPRRHLSVVVVLAADLAVTLCGLCFVVTNTTSLAAVVVCLC